MHQHDAAEAFLDVLTRVVGRAARGNLARVHAEEAEAADKRVGHNLEGQRGERRVVRSGTLLLLVGLGVDALDVRNVQRRRHIVHDCVQQALHALVFIRRAADHGHHRVGDGRLADGCFDLVDRQLLAAEEFLHQRFVGLGNMLDELVVVLLRLLGHIGRNLGLLDIGPEVVGVDIRLHQHKVDDALEIRLRTDGKLDGDGVALEAVLHHVDDAVKVGAVDVHFIDIRHAGDLILVRLPPNRFGLRFDAALRAQHRDGTVQNAQRALDLDGKVNVAGGIDDVDAMLLPEAGRRGRCDRDAALLLLLHPVHRCGALVRFTDLMRFTRIEQDSLRGCRFSRVDMRHNSDVTVLLERTFPRHRTSPLVSV